MSHRPLGAFKPHFEGQPDDYFPTTWWDILASILLIIMYIGGSLGMMISFIFWVMADGTSRYVLIWCIVCLVFLVLLIVGTYFGVRRKLQNERKLIQDKLKKERLKLQGNKGKNS